MTTHFKTKSEEKFHILNLPTGAELKAFLAWNSSNPTLTNGIDLLYTVKYSDFTFHLSFILLHSNIRGGRPKNQTEHSATMDGITINTKIIIKTDASIVICRSTGNRDTDRK